MYKGYGEGRIYVELRGPTKRHHLLVMNREFKLDINMISEPSSYVQSNVIGKNCYEAVVPV